MFGSVEVWKRFGGVGVFGKLCGCLGRVEVFRGSGVFVGLWGCLWGCGGVWRVWGFLRCRVVWVFRVCEGVWGVGAFGVCGSVLEV